MGEKESARNILNSLYYFRSTTLKTLNTEVRAAKKAKIAILWEFKAFVKNAWFESVEHIRANKGFRLAAIKRQIFVNDDYFFKGFVLVSL